MKALIQATLHAIRTLEFGREDGEAKTTKRDGAERGSNDEIFVHILESALFALGGLAEQSEEASERIFAFDKSRKFLSALMRCAGAVQASHPAMTASLPSEIARHALWAAGCAGGWARHALWAAGFVVGLARHALWAVGLVVVWARHALWAAGFVGRWARQALWAA